MKKLSLYIASLGLAAVAFTACDNEFERPPMVVPTSTWEANTTIAQLKQDYWSTLSAPVTVGLTESGDSVIIKGRVISSDESGNIFKYLMIQDEEEALAFTLDFYDIYQSYKLGQEVYVNVTGLTIGGYSGLMCVGNGTDDRGRVARCAEAIFTPHAQVNGIPNKALIDTVTATIPTVTAALASAEGQQTWQSRLVRFDNVRFEDDGQPYAVGTSSTKRYIIDQDGNRIMLYNSSYADFKDEPLPSGTGSVVGILSYFSPDWQILLNGTNGCIGFNGVSAPVFTPGAGFVKPGTEVTLSCPTEVADIYYTLDGTDPSASSTLYTAPIVVNEDVTIKAIAIFEGVTSTVATASYKVSDEAPAEGDGTAENPYNVAQAKAKAIENGSASTENVYVKGYVVSGSINLTYGTGTWTICDNPEGVGDTFELYGTYNTENGKFTDENAVKNGDLVVAVGPIFNYNNKTPEMSKGHLVSINNVGGTTPPTPPVTGAIFSETFLNGNLGLFTATVETNGSWTGWRANTSNPLCALANSYVSGTNEAATAWLVSPEISLEGTTAVTLSLEQAFGFYFPTEQGEYCTVNIREKGGDWAQLTLTAFPEKGSGNWTGWAENTIDISAYAGKTVEIGFKYVNDGAQSIAWEFRKLTVNAAN